MKPELLDDIAAVGRISAVPRILAVVQQVSGMRFSAVARVTQDQWVACAVRDGIGLGLAPGGELDVRTTLCEQVRDTEAIVVMDHADKDPVYCQHPTPKMYGFQSYISVPIFRDHAYFGTLCALDPRPLEVKTDKVMEMFTLFAELIGQQLEVEDRAARDLVDAQEQSQLREQFMAVLGHDLRSPLQSVLLGIEQLQRRADDDDARVLKRVQNSGLRIQRLVDDLMDFARTRLGGGFELQRRPADVSLLLAQVVSERGAAHPDRQLHLHLRGDFSGVDCDPYRLAQLVSNLIGNALEHSPKDAAVDVRAVAEGDDISVSVENGGPGIAADAVTRLFQPFVRGSGPNGKTGLGLGLFIADQIARAHGGALDVASEDGRTAFTLRLQRRPAA